MIFLIKRRMKALGLLAVLGVGVIFCGSAEVVAWAETANRGQALSRDSQKITGFRYQDCGTQDCLVIEAPKAWMSQISNLGSESSHILADGPVKMQILREGRLFREYRGESASLQGDVKLLSIETAQGSVIYDLETRQVVELFSADGRGKP